MPGTSVSGIVERLNRCHRSISGISPSATRSWRVLGESNCLIISSDSRRDNSLASLENPTDAGPTSRSQSSARSVDAVNLHRFGGLFRHPIYYACQFPGKCPPEFPDQVGVRSEAKYRLRIDASCQQASRTNRQNVALSSSGSALHQNWTRGSVYRILLGADSAVSGHLNSSYPLSTNVIRMVLHTGPPALSALALPSAVSWADYQGRAGWRWFAGGRWAPSLRRGATLA